MSNNTRRLYRVFWLTLRNKSIVLLFSVMHISFFSTIAQSDSLKMEFDFKDTCFNINAIHRSYDLLYLFPSSRAWPDSVLKEILDPLIEFLIKHSELEVEIGYHTDIRGCDSVNLLFSKHRAAFIEDKLHQFGVDSNRVSNLGYGESEPLFDEKSIYYSGLDYQSRDRLLLANHRIEIKIIGINKQE
jgi:outer membrane protein OmpA-like peptidoglycan-associated protein